MTTAVHGTGRVDALRRTALLRGVPDAVLDRLATVGVVRELAPGEVLFLEGDPSDDLVVVVSGRLKVVLTSSGERAELLLRIAAPGATLGEPSLVDGAARSATVVAIERTVVLSVPRDDVLEVAHEHPVVLEALLGQLAQLVRLLSVACADLVLLDLPRRVAKLLLAESVDGRVELDLSQSALGSMVGGSRQTVNSALGQLERRGWIERAGGRVLLRDEPALRRFVAS